MSISRKRLRSNDSLVILQSKYLINQKILDSRDTRKMEEVYEKTINLLFRGANHSNRTCKNNNKIEPDLCRSCQKIAKLHKMCINCNGDVCDLCQLVCNDCRSCLCSNCVVLFNCGSIDQPFCETCKTFSWR